MNHLVIVLGGRSPKNAKWAEKLANSFSKELDTRFHSYKHWEQNLPDINFDVELASVVNTVGSQKGSYSIIAKSAGALLALKGIASGSLKPSSIVCIGLPLTYAESHGISLLELIATDFIPTLFIQAKNDPLGSSKAVSSLTANHGDMVAIDGEDHDYLDIKQIVSIATPFFLSNLG